jgi:hypothetical protein
LNIKTFFSNAIFLFFLSVVNISCSSAPVENKYKQLYKGVGNNLEEAKVDAIRSALALQIPQYVLADRLVINSELKKDLTISTSSGFIRDFSVEDQYVDNNGFVVVIATISVSENKVKNYAAKRYEVYSANKKSDRFDGERQRLEVLAAKSRKEAEELRRLEQYKSAVQLTERLFAGYPFNILEANVTSVQFDPDDEQYINVYYEYDLNEEWRKSFWNKLKLIEDTLYDSGVRASYTVCPNSGTIIDSCRRIPASAEIPFPLLVKESTTPAIVIPFYNKDNKFEGCEFNEIIPPIGQLTESELEDMGGGQLLLGTTVLLPGAIVGATVATGAAVAAATVGTAAIIAATPFCLLGACGPANSIVDSIESIDSTEPEREWQSIATIYVLGPNPTNIDFQSSNFSGVQGRIRTKSSFLYSETKAASIFKPFVSLLRENDSGAWYFDVTNEPVAFKGSSFGKTSKANGEMCKYGASLR